MAHRIVLATLGGHIAAFHAAMDEMFEVLQRKNHGEWELWGAQGGLAGLTRGQLVPIQRSHLEPDRAGSLIGADRELADPEAIQQLVRQQGLRALVFMGGDNHLGEAAKLAAAGLPVVGYPKTMDGDLSSLLTLGWHTAVTAGAMQTRWHHHSAMTNRQVFFVGLFGRNTDWTLCGVAAYGGADLAVPCEEEYDADLILTHIQDAVRCNRDRFGVEFAVVPYSEGARLRGLNPPPEEHCRRDKHGQPKLQPEWLGLELVRLARLRELKACFQAHTYDLRDSPPTATDQRLSRLAGAACMEMVLDGDFGKAVVFEPDGHGFYRTGREPLGKVAVQRKVRRTGYFDYERLSHTDAFIQAYGDLFRNPLGQPPTKAELVYKNMV